jgi:voltage-gated potassium channel
VKVATSMLSMLSAPASASASSVRALSRLVLLFVVAVAIFSVGFHLIMDYEGQDHSWASAIYWTVVTMSTLGFGDIVFTSDVGRLYSVVVLLTGSLIILILLPFTFIQFVYVPWRAAMRRAKAPREVPPTTAGHVVLTGRDPMEEVLIHRAEAAGIGYVLLVEDLEEAIALHDRGYEVLVGALDDPATYRNVRADQAAMVVTAQGDTTNTNVAFTVREVTDRPVVVATATSADSVDVLQLAGADHVLQLGELLGGSFARRILAPSARSSPISTFEDLVIAEASAANTPLVGRTLSELQLRQRFGVSVVGVWDRGRFAQATPRLRIEPSSVLVLAGTREQLERYDTLLGGEDEAPGAGREAHVVILGGGRVGRATAHALAEAGIGYTIVEKRPERVRHESRTVIGDAADREVLEEAGIDRATSVVVTTHDDDVNIYLTLYCRRLRPEVQILGRVALDRNLSTMHRAGADFVLSYASTGATEAWNALRSDSTLLLAEGLIVFRVAIPPSLADKRLSSTDIPATTGCSVIGVVRDGSCSTAIDPTLPLPEDGELILIGDDEAEDRFLAHYVSDTRGHRLGRWWRRRRPGGRLDEEHDRGDGGDGPRGDRGRGDGGRDAGQPGEGRGRIGVGRDGRG